MFSVQSIGRWLRKAQGRDKLCKVLQYICRLMAAHQRPISQYKALIYTTLFQALREARKLFRIFKSVDEFQAIKHLLFFQQMKAGTFLQIAYHSCYFIYWILDNITVVTKVKIFSGNWKAMHALSLKIRCLALCISLTYFFFSLRTNNLNRGQKVIACLKGGRDILDLLPASKDAQLAGWLDQKLVSVGGLLSSLISTYMIYTSEANSQ